MAVRRVLCGSAWLMHSWVGDKQQRAAYEKQLTEVALKASQEKERLRELVRW